MQVLAALANQFRAILTGTRTVSQPTKQHRRASLQLSLQTDFLVSCRPVTRGPHHTDPPRAWAWNYTRRLYDNPGFHKKRSGRLRCPNPHSPARAAKQPDNKRQIRL